MNKTDLLQKKGMLADQAAQILAAAREDKREELTKDEEKRFFDIHADIDKITKTIEAYNKQEAIEKSLSEVGERTIAPNKPANESERQYETRLAQGAKDHYDAMRGWFLRGARKGGVVVPDHMQAAAKRVGLDLEQTVMNFRLAPEGLRCTGHGPDAMRVREEDLTRWGRYRDEERAMSGPQSSTSLGGFSIQDAAMRELEIALLAFGGMRQVSTVIRTDTGGPLPIPTTNDSTNVGALIAENTTVGTQDVVLGQLVLDAFKYTSKAVLVSVELMQDNSINLPQVLGRLLGERLGRITNTHYTTGTGTGQPNGIVTAASFTQATTNNTTQITYANLIALYHSVDPAYRLNARWMMNDNSISKIKLLVDSQSRPLWLPGLVDRAPDTILGSPYTINQDMATMTASAKSILFGDLSKYLIRDVRDFTLMRLDERFAEFLQVAFLAFLRTDGDLLNAGTNPVKGYQNST